MTRYLRQAPRRLMAFTLIEFIVVMALLAIVMAIAAPSLSNFFRGRKLSSEARRFVSLARFGQSRAVSDGTPMILWLDRTEGTYGLREQDGYSSASGAAVAGSSAQDLAIDSSRVRARVGHEAVDVKQPEFRLADDLRFQLTEGSQTNGRIVTIRFLPDGAIDEGSLRSLVIQQQPRSDPGQGKSESIWIVQSRDLSRYEIVDETSALDRLNSTEPTTLGGLYPR